MAALYQKLRESEAAVRSLQAEARERMPSTQKYTKSARVKRAQQAEESKRRLATAANEVAGE